MVGNPISEIIGLKRGAEKAEPFQIPESYFGRDGRENPFGFLDKPVLGPNLFVDAILDNQPLQPDFYDAYKVQQVIQAALESSKTGKAIYIKWRKRRKQL